METFIIRKQINFVAGNFLRLVTLSVLGRGSFDDICWPCQTVFILYDSLNDEDECNAYDTIQFSGNYIGQFSDRKLLQFLIDSR